MSASWWLVLGAATLGGAAGGTAVLLLDDAEPSSPAAVELAERTDEEPPDDGEAPKADEEDSAELRAEVRALERRVSLLTAALAARRDAEAEPNSAADAGPLGDVDVADPVFEAAVLDILERERTRSGEEKAARRKERDADRNARIVSDLGSRLGLRPDQNERLGALITEQFAKVSALRDDESESRPVTRRQWRERMDAIAAETEAELGELLTPAQLAAYRALHPDDQLHLGGNRRVGGRASADNRAPQPSP